MRKPSAHGRRPRGQRGAALVVTMMVVIALLAAGALALYLQMADTHSAQYVTQKRGALYCAESGLAGARDYILANATSWPTMLDSDSTNDPVGYPVEGDLDGDNVNDWHVVLRDDDDEFPTNDPTVDTNGTVFMVATCLAYPDTPREILQMISVSGGGMNYRNQSGQGAGNTNNAN
jgi:Tfp pilus assembly protein PilX